MRRVLLAALALAAIVVAGRTGAVRADAFAAVSRGNASLAAGDLAAAEEAYREAVAHAPWLAEGWRGLAEVALARGEIEAALAAAGEALRLEPDDLAAGVLRVRILLAADSYAAAAAAAEEVLARHPWAPEALRWAGFAYWAAGRPAEAERIFRRRLRRGEDADAWFGLARTLEDLSDTLGALAAYRKALAADPDHVPANRALARLLIALGRPREAEGLLARAVRAAEAAAQTYEARRDRLLLSRLLAARGARNEAERVVEEAEEGPRRRFALGVLAEARGDLDAARRHFAAAYRLAPEDDLARFRLEEVLLRSAPATDTDRVRLAARRAAEAEEARKGGDLAEAERLLTRAVRLAPQDARIRFERARLLARRGAIRLAMLEAARAEELTRDPAERFAILDASERWVAAALDRLEATLGVSLRDLRLAPPAARIAFLRDTAALERRLDWLPGPWPRPRFRLAVAPFEEEIPPAHPEVGRTIPLLLGDALVGRDDIEVVAPAAPHDAVLSGSILETEDEVRIAFRLVSSDGTILLRRTVSAKGRRAFSRAASAVAWAVEGAVRAEGEVLHIARDEVFVNLGLRNALAPGETLAVLGPRPPSPVPGVARPDRAVRALLEVVEVAEPVARARIVSGDPEAVKLLDPVRPVRATP